MNNIIAKIKLFFLNLKVKDNNTTITKTVTDEEIVYMIVIKRKPK